MKRDRNPRGIEDLAAVWRTLPAAVIQYPVLPWSLGSGLSGLCDFLRARCWRAYCAAGPVACADRNVSCQMADTRRCIADQLFPVSIGGGAKSWRMATFFLHWRPSVRALHLVALGETACRQIKWAGECLENKFGLPPAVYGSVRCFADLELCQATRWQLMFVTPWCTGKNLRGGIQAVDSSMIHHELVKNLRWRAHKFTALCTHEPLWQRMGGHLAHYLADQFLVDSLAVEQPNVTCSTFDLASSNKSSFTAYTWQGEAVLRVDPQLLPWLSLLQLCGGGENADKGFGSIELTPFQSVR